MRPIRGQDAEIIESALQISVGAGGLGKALLVPEYSNNEIYFQLKSVSVLGSPVPASSLPADIQEEIKSRSSRSITVPKGLKIIAVSLDSEGLSVKFQGRNLLLDNLTL